MIGRITLWCLGLALALYALDNLAGRFLEWRKRRDLHIKAKDLARFNIGVAFRGARKFDDPRWPT